VKSGSLIGSRGNWRSDSADPVWAGLPGDGRAERLRRLQSGATIGTAAATSATGNRTGAIANRRPGMANSAPRLSQELDVRSSNGIKWNATRNKGRNHQEPTRNGSSDMRKAEGSTPDPVFSSAR